MNQKTFQKINSYALIFAITVILFLALIRLSNLFLFGNLNDIQHNASSLNDLFIVGLRFDLRVVGTALLLFVYLPYIFILWKKNKAAYLSWVKFILGSLLALVIALSFIDIGYFVFFGTAIDILIFGLFEDDTQAVIASGLSDPRLLFIGALALIITLLIIFAYFKISKAFAQKTPSLLTPQSLWALVFILPLLVVAARGSIDTFPLSQRQSSISNNSFINSLTQNAVFHLKYAYKHRKANNFNKSLQQILAAAQVKSSDELMQKSGFNAALPLIRHTTKNTFLEKKPPHVIFILMEGWSAHIALNDSVDNPVLGQFKKHSKDDYFLTRFFSNKYGTNPTIENTLLNTPLTPLSQSSAYKTSFSMSNIKPFKQKGYQTSFISGGYSSWRNHDVFWPKQGFDRYIDRSVIEELYQVESDNPWGVYDEYLFKYLQKDLLQQKKPSLSFVLTTNNHPPVRLPQDYVAPQFDAEKFGFKDNLKHKETMLSAYQYQTNALGEFLDWLKDSDLKDDVIVIATGDHILKGFADYNSIEKQFLRYAVPAYFYIPEQYNQFSKQTKEAVNNLIGSHVDLFPTLFELSLSDAPYYAFGTALMKKNKSDAYGWIDQKVFLVDQGVIDAKTNKLYLWSKQNKFLLNTNDNEPSIKHREIIKQEKYRRWLKELLLRKDASAE
ncbi:MAG TPA: alkaline phosphatase family protein [Leucothrix mucor]|nr:alkaline phosphatase family protein [Leucothrix mucor]